MLLRNDPFFTLKLREGLKHWPSACSADRTIACDPHALGGDRCPDLRHSTTTTEDFEGTWSARMTVAMRVENFRARD